MYLMSYWEIRNEQDTISVTLRSPVAKPILTRSKTRVTDHMIKSWLPLCLSNLKQNMGVLLREIQENWD